MYTVKQLPSMASAFSSCHRENNDVVEFMWEFHTSKNIKSSIVISKISAEQLWL